MTQHQANSGASIVIENCESRNVHFGAVLNSNTAAFKVQGGEIEGTDTSQSAERTGAKETAATYYAVSALREALLGDGYNARLQAKTAKRRSTGRDMDYGLALALAYAGDTNGAQALADDLENRFPQDTIVQLNYVPTVRARLAINHANPQQALDLLRVAGPYELGLPAIGFYNWPNLYPVYVRGEAYLAAHRGGEAAAEFQRILDHPAIVNPSAHSPISNSAAPTR